MRLLSVVCLLSFAAACSDQTETVDSAVPTTPRSDVSDEPQLMTAFGLVGGGGGPCDINGWVNGVDVCDNGIGTEDDGCNENILTDTCYVLEGWVCLNPGVGQPQGPSICHEIVCGDGNPDVGPDPQDPIERCDDDNTLDGDGCNSTCDVEPGWTCEDDGLNPSVCFRCGDGLLEEGEECDDDDVYGGDGCDAGCNIEEGWQCTATSPSVCHFKCGDGDIDFPEECDEGTQNSDVLPDRCRMDCRNPRCRDGVVDSGEYCDTGGSYSPGGDVGFCNATCTDYLPLTFFPVEHATLTPAPSGAVGLLLGEEIHDEVCTADAPDFVGYGELWDFVLNFDALVGLQVVLTEDIEVENPIFIAAERLDDRRLLRAGAEHMGVGLGRFEASAGTTVLVDMRGLSLPDCDDCGRGGQGSFNYCPEHPIGGGGGVCPDCPDCSVGECAPDALVDQDFVVPQNFPSESTGMSGRCDQKCFIAGDAVLCLDPPPPPNDPISELIEMPCAVAKGGIADRTCHYAEGLTAASGGSVRSNCDWCWEREGCSNLGERNEALLGIPDYCWIAGPIDDISDCFAPDFDSNDVDGEIRNRSLFAGWAFCTSTNGRELCVDPETGGRPNQARGHNVPLTENDDVFAECSARNGADAFRCMWCTDTVGGACFPTIKDVRKQWYESIVEDFRDRMAPSPEHVAERGRSMSESERRRKPLPQGPGDPRRMGGGKEEPGAESDDNQPDAKTGDPLSLATGELVMSATDISFPSRGVPFELTRYYRSGGDWHGSLGPGWTHSYEEVVEPVGFLFNSRGMPRYWDAALVCQWVKTTDRNGHDSHYGLNFMGNVIVEAHPTQSGATHAVKALRRFNADGLVTLEAAADGSYTYVDGHPLTRGLVESVLEVADVPVALDVSGTVTTVTARDSYFTYEPLFQQLASVEASDGTITRFVYDYQQMSLSDGVAQARLRDIEARTGLFHGDAEFLGVDLDGDGVSGVEGSSGLVLSYVENVDSGNGVIVDVGARTMRDDCGTPLESFAIKDIFDDSQDTDRVQYLYYESLADAEAGAAVVDNQCRCGCGPLAITRSFRTPTSTAAADLDEVKVAYDALGGVRESVSNSDIATTVTTERNSVGLIVHEERPNDLHLFTLHDARGQPFIEYAESPAGGDMLSMVYHAWGNQGVLLGSCRELDTSLTPCQLFFDYAVDVVKKARLAQALPPLLADASYTVTLFDNEDVDVGHIDAAGGRTDVVRGAAGLVSSVTIQGDPNSDLTISYAYDIMMALGSTARENSRAPRRSGSSSTDGAFRNDRR